MARRTKVYTVKDEKSRDNGKSFVITEMSAEAAEWWAFRVLQALLGSNAEVDFNAPLADMARQGLGALGKLSPEIAKPLLDEMMDCIRIKLPSGSESRDMLPGDIEEVKTRVILRKEVLALHMDFFDLGGV